MRAISVFWLGAIVVLTKGTYAQQSYNACSSALELCPNTTFTVNNIGASKTVCGGCEDDFNYCFAPLNTIWLQFTTQATGGNVQIDLLNPIFQIENGRGTTYSASLIEAGIACIAGSYNPVGNCISVANGNQTITANALQGNKVYYLVLSGEAFGMGVTLPAEFTIDVQISGSAVDRTLPTVNLNITSGFCIGDMITLEAQRFDCPEASNFRWLVNGILQGVTTSPIFSVANLQPNDIIHVQTDCFTLCPYTAVDSVALSILNTVWANAGNDTMITLGETIQLHGAASNNSVFAWTPSFSVSNPNSLSPIAYPIQTTTYTLTITDTISGCVATDYVVVTVQNELSVPNTFSPNNDGDNDTWEIIGIERFPDCLVSVYSRWGQLVFQTTGYNKQKAWNGESNVGTVNESVYFYEIQLRDEQKQILNGSITVIR